MHKTFEIYTDGSCLGNPGPGVYGLVMKYQQHLKELSGGFIETTNNRMELMAAIAALEALKEACDATLHTDSQYVRQGITEWMPNWIRRGWKTAGGDPVKNRDLWERLAVAVAAHAVRWSWVRGHAGHAENERVDALARAAAEGVRSGAGALRGGRS